MSAMKTIIYVNYSPYENSGKILDYLIETFPNVLHFSIGFHHLKNKKNYNRLLIFDKGRLKKEYLLFQLPIAGRFLFLLLPIRSIINCLLIMGYSFWLNQRYKTIDVYFTVNAFTAWIGNLLRSFGVVKKTVFWVWDYYPPIHQNKVIMLMRYIYWQFDKISSFSDRVAFVNPRLLELRKDIGIFPKSAKYPIIPIGTDKFPFPNKKNIKKVSFGYIGVIKKSQGLGIVFDNADNLRKEFGDVSFNIVGSGPDEEFFKQRAKSAKFRATFFGYLEEESFNKVLSKCTIGIATYVPDASNVAHFGDQGKIKRYLSLGIPVIATNVSEFSKKIDRSEAGVVVDYNSQTDFIEAVKKIMREYSKYSQNAYKLSQVYYYKKIYPEMFKF